MPRGGPREGAGRPPKKGADPNAVGEAVRTLLEMATGQSSVHLELDSKQQVKPDVVAYHRSVHKAGELAQAEFDRLMGVYYPKPSAAPSSLDQFSDEDLKLLGLQRTPTAT